VTSPTVPSFVGRAADRDRLAAVLRQLHGGLSAALVLSGDAGIGKTQLLRRTVDDAGDIQTIMVSGYESEIGLGFAALHRLVLPLLGDLSELPAPQREALAVAFGLESGTPPNRFLVGLATMTLLERTARDGPLLCVVDDVQWVDQETLDTLAFVARRLDAEGVGVILGLRSSGLVPAGLSGIPEHRLPPMSEQDMRSLLSAAARTRPAPQVAARLITESEGNPLALLEYAASLSPERLAGTAELPPALPVGERLSTGFAAQIARLPGPTRQLLLVLAAAGPDDTGAVSETCRRLGIGPDAGIPAVRDSILSAQPRLVFRHPLIRSVAYDSAGLAAQRRVHAVLAGVAADRRFADAAAWHRAYATPGPDEDVAAQLEVTAARARERGGYAAEANFLTLAAQRSIAGTDDHTRRLLAAARANIVAGHGMQAEQLLDGSDARGTVGARIEAARVEAILLSNDPRHAGAPAMLMKAAGDLPAEEIDLARQLLCSALRAAVGSRELTVGTSLREVAQALLSRPRPAGREPAPVDLLYEGLATRCALGYRPAVTVMREALRQLARQQDVAAAQSVPLLTWLVMEDLWDDEFESTTWTEMTASNRMRGALPSVWVGLGSSAITEARHGNFDTAQALFDEAISLSVAVGAHSQVAWSVLTEFRAWQGREAETRSMADTLIREWTGERRYGSSTNFALLALTVLDLSLGHYAAALAHAKTVALDDPPGHGSRILPDLIEAASRAGDDAAAGEALDELTVRARAAGTPWALGLLTRSRAVALSGSAEAGPHYEEALHLLDATPLRTETARTQLLYGEWLRRRKRRKDAREQLSAALSAFTGMGATIFAQRTALELAAAGARPVATAQAQRPALTPQERRVAELAAHGMTNSEISERLFISYSTVDYHLSKVFRKLDITSRRRLRDTLDR
jgi:DNA-binding CsgD family transcriptional regulator